MDSQGKPLLVCDGTCNIDNCGGHVVVNDKYFERMIKFFRMESFNKAKDDK